MNEMPCCPVCNEETWRSIEHRVYRKSGMSSLSDYTQKRYRVLFEVWTRGQDEIRFTSCVCQSCGFVTNLPRPSSVDIEEKYRFIAKLGQDYGQGEGADIARRRSKHIFLHCKKYLGTAARVLDYGGGDGRLMQCFSEAGMTATWSITISSQ